MGATPETPLERRLRLQRDVEEKAAQYRLYLRTSASGLEFGLSVVVGAVLGFFADRWLHSAPWGLFIGLAFGLAAGGRTLYRMAKQSMSEDDVVAEGATIAVPAEGEARDVRLG